MSNRGDKPAFPISTANMVWDHGITIRELYTALIASGGALAICDLLDDGATDKAQVEAVRHVQAARMLADALLAEPKET